MLWEVEAKIILLSRRKQSEGKTVASPLWRPENYLGQMWQPEKQPFTDGYWALPPNLSNQQTIGQFCHFLWIILTSSSDHDAVMWHLFIWLISCMSQIFTQCVTHMLHTATTFHHITSLQCTDKKGIFCNRKLLKTDLKKEVANLTTIGGYSELGWTKCSYPPQEYKNYLSVSRHKKIISYYFFREEYNKSFT